MNLVSSKKCVCVENETYDDTSIKLKKIESVENEDRRSEVIEIDAFSEENIIEKITEKSYREEWENPWKYRLFSSSSHERSVNYLCENVFPTLISAIKETLVEAQKWNAILSCENGDAVMRNIKLMFVQKCRFNAIDHLAEILYNRNPRRWKASKTWVKVFDIPQFKLLLRLHPRPLYPKSWLWSNEEAAMRIQRYVRGWLVRKHKEVQEMRQFWKALRTGKKTIIV
ncbi:hypothetical protein KM043_011483 [Ampulex compressa]|nr:hypothetical protein KM043_011483 [Ampulex compressa]